MIRRDTSARFEVRPMSRSSEDVVIVRAPRPGTALAGKVSAAYRLIAHRCASS
jgi:hypothetical protein